VSVTHGQCDDRPTVTFPACTKFTLLGDSWLPRILILLHTRLDSLGLTLYTDPGSYPGRYAGQASEHVLSLVVADYYCSGVTTVIIVVRRHEPHS